MACPAYTLACMNAQRVATKKSKSTEVALYGVSRSYKKATLATSFPAPSNGHEGETLSIDLLTTVPTGAPNIQTIERDPADPILEAFFRDLDRQIVQRIVPADADMNPHRAPNGGRRGPILTLAENHRIFDYVESPPFRESKLAHVIGAAEIVRRRETISLTDAKGSAIKGSYLTDRPAVAASTFAKTPMPAVPVSRAAGAAGAVRILR